MVKIDPVPEAIDGNDIAPAWGNLVRLHTDHSLARLGTQWGDMIHLGSDLRPQKLSRPDHSSLLYHPGGDDDWSYVRFAHGTPSINDIPIWDGEQWVAKPLIDPATEVGSTVVWDGTKYVPGAGGIRRHVQRVTVPEYDSRNSNPEPPNIDILPDLTIASGDIIVITAISDSSNQYGSVVTSNVEDVRYTAGGIVQSAMIISSVPNGFTSDGRQGNFGSTTGVRIAFNPDGKLALVTNHAQNTNLIFRTFTVDVTVLQVNVAM